MTSEFGATKRNNVYESYIGRWVIIYSQGLHTNFSGKVTEIKEGYALLNPFQAGEVKEGMLVRKLIEDERGALVPLEGSAVEPTTEDHLRSWCEIMNKRDSEKKDSATSQD